MGMRMHHDYRSELPAMMSNNEMQNRISLSLVSMSNLR